MREVPIKGEMIRLGQLLKLADLIDAGAHARDYLAGGSVTVNGERETRRGRQLRPGDVVLAGGVQLQVTAQPGQ